MVSAERLEEMREIHGRNRDLQGYLPEKVRQMNSDVCAALDELIDVRHELVHSESVLALTVEEEGIDPIIATAGIWGER